MYQCETLLFSLCHVQGILLCKVTTRHSGLKDYKPVNLMLCFKTRILSVLVKKYIFNILKLNECAHKYHRPKSNIRGSFVHDSFEGV
jgi:hypothetical protein